MDFKTYKRMLAVHGGTSGQVKKTQSDIIIENSWWEDIQSRVCYIYDYYHDDEKGKYRNMNPTESASKIPIDTKFIITQYGTLAKGEVEYHIQFRPSQNCPLDYFEKEYEQKYSSEFPVGLYIDIPDDKGVFNKWLICAKHIGNQFIKYSVLPCNYNLMWIDNGIKHQMSSIIRTSNSYTSGVWTDYIFTSTNDQNSIWLPSNKLTDNIRHDKRFVVSAPIEEPLVWSVTKVDRVNISGITKLTMVQDKFNQFKDYVNLETYEMYADYYDSKILPIDEVNITNDNDNIVQNTCNIKCSGTSPQLKVGGGYKTLTANILDSNNNDVTTDYNIFNWIFKIDDIEINDLMYVLEQDAKNSIKVKFLGDETYIGKLINVNCKCESLDTVDGNIEIEVICL
jgi:hypothetical protein